MPISYEIDAQAGIIRVVAFGRLSIAQVQDFHLLLQRDPRFNPSYPRLVDARHLEQEFSPADIRRLADVVRADAQGGAATRRAMVLEAPEYLRLVEVFRAYIGKHPAEYRVFQSLAEAERWLTTGSDGFSGRLASCSVTSPETRSRGEKMTQTDPGTRETAGDPSRAGEARPDRREKASASPQGDSAAGRENPAAGPVDGDEAIGNRVGTDELAENDGTEPTVA